MAKFKIGDIVEFELDARQLPRWDLGKDRGASGKMSTGEVTEANEHEFTVRYSNKKSALWDFTYEDSAEPGFPILKSKFKPVDRFKVGDRVVFEWSKSSSTTPRINLGTDQGASGKYGKGIVASVEGNEFNIRFDAGNYNFSYNDKDQPGFPKLDVPNEEQIKGIDLLKRWLNNDQS